MAEDIFEFVRGESVLALRRRLQSSPAQEHVRGSVQDIDEKEKDVIEDEEWRCNPKGNPRGR